jgi:hypothetical protein
VGGAFVAGWNVTDCADGYISNDGQLALRRDRDFRRLVIVAQLFKLVFKVDHKGYAVNEGAAFDLPTATRLVASGICRIADDEPEREALEAVVRVYKEPKQTGHWQMPLVGPRWPGWH